MKWAFLSFLGGHSLRHPTATNIDRDRLAIGPQCRFASTVAGNPLSEADQRTKLRLVTEAAQRFFS